MAGSSGEDGQRVNPNNSSKAQQTAKQEPPHPHLLQEMEAKRKGLTCSLTAGEQGGALGQGETGLRSLEKHTFFCLVPVQTWGAGQPQREALPLQPHLPGQMHTALFGFAALVVWLS